MFRLVDIMLELAAERPVFHSEADFQHALAWQIQTTWPDTRVRLEYRPLADEPMYTDIWCEWHDQSLAIELKYPTRELTVADRGERFVILNHSAQDVTRYFFVKDIVRLERVVAQRPNTAAAAIMLTNEPLFWKTPVSRLPTIDEAFRIHDGRALSGHCAWSAKAGKGTTAGKEAPLDLQGTYRLAWHNYVSFPEQRWGQFRFVNVEPERAPAFHPAVSDHPESGYQPVLPSPV